MTIGAGSSGGAGGGGGGEGEAVDASTRAKEAAAKAAGWRKCFSSTHNKDFWHHKATDRRAWSLEKALASGSGGGSGGANSSRSTDGTAHGGAGGKRAKQMWKKGFSEKRQRTFWVHRETKAHSWHRPEGYESD